MQGNGCVCVKNYPPEIMQPSSSTRATIVSAENQNGATIVKATFFFCHYYIVWEANIAGEAPRGQSWNESLKSRWIPGGSCGYTSGTKRKHFAALSSPRPCWRWLQLQPSCGSPQWVSNSNVTNDDMDPHKGPVTCSVGVSFVDSLNKLSNKKPSWGWFKRHIVASAIY